MEILCHIKAINFAKIKRGHKKPFCHYHNVSVTFPILKSFIYFSFIFIYGDFNSKSDGNPSRKQGNFAALFNRSFVKKKIILLYKYNYL